jgi:hypothetical protein
MPPDAPKAYHLPAHSVCVRKATPALKTFFERKNYARVSSKCEPGAVLHDEGSVEFFNRPRWWEATYAVHNN